MSRNSKGHKLTKQKQAMQKLRTSGGSGPKATTPLHGKSKDKRWFMNGITKAGEAALKKAKHG